LRRTDCAVGVRKGRERGPGRHCQSDPKLVWPGDPAGPAQTSMHARPHRRRRWRRIVKVGNDGASNAAIDHRRRQQRRQQGEGLQEQVASRDLRPGSGDTYKTPGSQPTSKRRPGSERLARLTASTGPPVQVARRPAQRGDLDDLLRVGDEVELQEGDGRAGRGAAFPRADLTAMNLWRHPLSHGKPAGNRLTGSNTTEGGARVGVRDAIGPMSEGL
jgi:hypothetical protein